MRPRPQDDGTLTIEDATILFRNFAGAAKQYNREGDRNFSLIIDDRELIDLLIADGWNVKTLRARDPEDEDRFHIPVSVSYKLPTRQPRVTLVTSSGRTPLPEDLVELADMVDIDTVDLTIRGNPWEVQGNKGRKAYLQTIFIRVREDPLDLKYADVPIIGQANPRDLYSIQAQQTPEIESRPHYDYEGEVVEG